MWEDEYATAKEERVEALRKSAENDDLRASRGLEPSLGGQYGADDLAAGPGVLWAAISLFKRHKCAVRVPPRNRIRVQDSQVVLHAVLAARAAAGCPENGGRAHQTRVQPPCIDLDHV